VKIDVWHEIPSRRKLKEMGESRPETISEHAGRTDPVVGHNKAPAWLLNAVISKEPAAAAPAQSPEVRENALLSEPVEALQGGVPAGLLGRDKVKIDTENL